MNRLRILLVEDDAAYARFLREVLSEASGLEHELAWAQDLASGLASLAASDVDIVLLDLGLPDADGLEAVTRVSAAAPRTPIVVLSGVSDVDAAIDSIRGGAQEYLVKGQAEHAILARTIRYAIERKQVQDFEQMLVGIVGHDLRGPLHLISMASRVLADDAALGATQKRRVEQISNASRRATALVNDLLDVTRVRLLGQVIPIVRSVVDLEPVVRQIVDEFAFAHGGDRVGFTGAADATGSFDGTRIGQVVANLLRNAAEHGERGKPIRVAMRSADGAVDIDVHNDGPPIPPELLPHVFEPLRRGRPLDGETKGLGLGLFIVKQIVAAHGGRVEASSSVDAGTTFRVTLPRHVA